MNGYGVRAVAVTSEVLADNPSLWKNIEEGQYDMIFISPELLVGSGSYFWKSIAKNKKSAFIRRLRLIVVDEVHCIWKWGESGFRRQYTNIGALRAYFPKVPFMCMSATLTLSVLSYTHKVLNMQKPSVLYKQSIRRENICVSVSKIVEAGFSDLNFLVDSSAKVGWKIPKTMVFLDDCSGTQSITR